MYHPRIYIRFSRLPEYYHVLLLIFPLILVISPSNLPSTKAVIVFLANVFLTAFSYAFNDVEDAKDDYHDQNKRNRNPISSGEITKNHGYLFSLFLVTSGLILLWLINPTVFVLGIFYVFIGFFYSWNGFKLKSMPVLDLVSHVLFLGALQFLITYLTFRPLDLLITPFLMIIISFSAMNQIIHEMEDFKIDNITNTCNTVQRFEGFEIKKVLQCLVLTSLVGFSVILYNLITLNNFINLLMTALIGVVAFFSLYARAIRVL
jgi:4-hydroxybenzoate polyprenyltransferase